MATVRELIAKLGFEVDTSGADEFQKKINGLKQGLGTLFTAKILKGATNLEDSFRQAHRQIENISGAKGLEVLDYALKNLGGTVSELDIAEGIRSGLEQTTDPEFIKRLSGFAVLAADAFGGTFQENMDDLVSGALSGDFGAAVKKGLISAQEAEFLKGAQINTVQGKLTYINFLEKKRLLWMKLQAEAMEDSTKQADRFSRNMENLGKMIGGFLSPIFAGFLDIVNDIFEFFIGSKMGQALAKFTAFAGLVVTVTKPIQFIGAILSKMGISIGGMIGGLARIASLWGVIFTAANEFYRLLTGASLLKPFEIILESIPQVIAAFEKMGSFFGGKIGEKFGGLIESIGNIDFGAILGGEAQAQPSLAMAGAGGQTVDNRKIEINQTVNGGDPEQLKAATLAGVKDSGFSRATSRARDEIAARDTQRIGANAQ
jgi:hypothetical protein